jgi:hypothetical protein
MATLALTISLAIDPMSGARGASPEGLPPTERNVEIVEGADDRERPPPLVSETEAKPEHDDHGAEEAPSPRVRLALGAGALGALGSAPGPALGFVAFVRARLRDASATLEGRADLPAGGDADGGSGRVSSSLLALTLLPCGHTGVFFACARGSIGRLSAEGLDVTHPGSSGALWAAAGGRLGWELPLGGAFALRVSGDADVVFTRFALQIGGRTAFTYAPVAGALGAALVVGPR